MINEYLPEDLEMLIKDNKQFSEKQWWEVVGSMENNSPEWFYRLLLFCQTHPQYEMRRIANQMITHMDQPSTSDYYNLTLKQKRKTLITFIYQTLAPVPETPEQGLCYSSERIAKMLK